MKRWSEEAHFFAASLPIIVGIALFIKIPLIVFVVAAILEVICYVLRMSFEDMVIRGKIGVATYIVYPVRIGWRFLMALVSIFIHLFLFGGLIIGGSWLVAAGIAYVARENPMVYALIISGLLKAAAVGACVGADVFTRPLATKTLEKLNETIEAMNEGVLVLTWVAIVGVTIIVTLSTPLFLPFVDIQPQFGWPFLQLSTL